MIRLRTKYLPEIWILSTKIQYWVLGWHEYFIYSMHHCVSTFQISRSEMGIIDHRALSEKSKEF